jgi:TolA-binding protein
MQAYAWADARKKELAYTGVAVALVGLVASYWLYHRAARETAAGEALSQASAAVLESAGKAEKPEGYLKVAVDYAGTSAGGQALLRAATVYFTEGKYAEAQTHFERFVRDHRDSPLLGQAMFGVAACLEAQGKTSDALDRYKNLLDRRPKDNVIPQTRLNLGRVYEAQGKPELAKPLYLEVTRTSPYGVTSSEASARLEALLAKHPELVEPPPMPSSATNAPAIKLSTP